MTDILLRLIYGGIVISSGFLICSMGRLAAREFSHIGGYAALRSIYFWLAANLAMTSAALVIICGIRTLDAFHGDPANSPGAWSWPLVVGFGLLLMSKAGFNWAGTQTMPHGRAVWWSFIASMIAWLVFGVTYSVR